MSYTDKIKQRNFMLKKGLHVSILMLFIIGCAGTVRVAQEETTTPTQPQVAKPIPKPIQ